MTDQAAGSGRADTGTVTVVLLDVPVPLYQKTRELYDELRHELFLVSHPASSVPTRLQELSEHLSGQFGPLGALGHPAIERAVDTGGESANLDYAFPVESAESIGQLVHQLDEVEEYCRRERLLTRPAPPDVLAFRRWFLGEFLKQAAGGSPTSWITWVHEQTEESG